MVLIKNIIITIPARQMALKVNRNLDRLKKNHNIFLTKNTKQLVKN